VSIPPSYLEDASGYRGHAERLFVPENETEVARILAEAAASKTPVTVAGSGSGLTGGRVAEGGWVLSTEKFTQLEVSTGKAIAGAGVPLGDLHAAAARTGQFYPPDPTEISAYIGGTIGTNASGARSFRYGATRAHVERLRVVLVGGEVLDVARGEKPGFPVPAIELPRSSKSTVGYPLAPDMDLIDLFIGSEGTLGVVTEAELRLLHMPERVLTAVVFFPSEDAVLQAVDDWRTVTGLRALEYFDGPSLRLMAATFDDIPASAEGALLVEQESSCQEDEELDAWIDRLEAAGAEAERSWFAASEADRERIRKFRHALPERVNDIVRGNGFLKYGTDFAVPPERNRDMLAFYRERLEAEFRGRYVIYGHIGDAHLHVNMLPESTEDSERAERLFVAFARRAVELGGAVSAEHGLGKRKRHLLAIQYPEEAIQAMREVKSRFDPEWLLGRGTLFAAP